MTADRDRRIDEAIADYLAGCDAGRPPDRAAFLAKYPDLTDSLAEFLADHQRMRGAAGHDPGATIDSGPAADTRPPAGSPVTVRYIGDYELLAEVARGGMGVVYKARQVSLNREVAVKMILAGQLAGPADVARFRAEAEAAANLDHPNILPVYEVGDHQGQQYFAMKLVPGGSLAGRLAESPRTNVRRLCELLAKVCRAVDFAHKRGILHRDLKPANILLDADGTPYVTDFGLARRLQGESGLTQTGAIVGTPSYMAPEQARAEKQLTTAADVFSLGAILYEALTGRPPFKGATVMDTVLQVLEKEPDHPQKIDPQADRDLSAVALKCLEKDPAQRYESAAALADDLDRWGRGELVSVRPATRVERVVKWARRKPTLAAAYGLTAVVLVLAGLVAGAAWLWQRAEGARREAVAAQAEAERQKDKFERFDYGRTVQMAHQEWREDNVPAAVALLDSTPDHLRGWEWRYVHRLCHSDLVTLKGHTSQIMSATFSPDGSRVLTGSSDTTARVWDAKTGELLLTLKHPGSVRRSAFSPDGTRIVTSCTDNTAKVWDARTGADLRTLTGHTKDIYSAEFSPDGTRVATASMDETGKVWDASTGAVIHTLTGHMSWVTSASFSTDGSRVVTSGHDNNARVWDTATGAEVCTCEGAGGQGSSAWFSKDGTKVVAGSGWVWDAKTGTSLPKGSAGPVRSPAFTPDGSRFVTGRERSATVWDAKTGTAVQSLKGHTGMIWSASYSPDGTRIVTGGDDYTAKVWDPAGAAEVVTLTRQFADVAAAFSPDGSRVVMTSKDLIATLNPDEKRPFRVTGASQKDTAKVCDARTGAVLAVLVGHTNTVTSAAFGPDGARVVTGSWDHSARVWDLTRGEKVHVLKEAGQAYDTFPGAAQVWTLKGHTNHVASAAFSPDGSQIVTGSWDNTAKVWDAHTGAELVTFKGHNGYVASVAFSPDGSKVLTVGWDHVARIWDPTTGAELRAMQSGAWAGAWSPDGTKVVTGSGDATPKVWDAETGAELLGLKAHTAEVLAVAWSPDGTRILTSGWDKTAKVWDAKTGAEVLTLKGHTLPVRSVGWSADGSRIVTGGGQDHTARVWDASPVSREFLPR